MEKIEEADRIGKRSKGELRKVVGRRRNEGQSANREGQEGGKRGREKIKLESSFLP